MKAGLTVTEQIHGAVLIVHLAGYLDGHTCAEMDRRATALLARHQRLVLELSGLGYIASAGVGIFINLQHRAQKAGGNLQLVNPSPGVREIFAILGLESLFVIHATLAEGVAAAAA
mgnify:CR=1 FL=1